MNIERILKATECGDIYPNNREEAKKKYRELSKLFHPDSNSDVNSSEAFTTISKLYSEALECFDKGTWNEKNTLYIKSICGKSYQYKYIGVLGFELGNMYYSRKNIFYVLDKCHRKYYNNYIEAVGKFTYADDSMRKEVSRYLPDIVTHFESTEGFFVIILRKTEDVVPLRLIKDIEKEHLAWIISRLSNICCYLEYCGLSHNGISVNNCFISPNFHTVLLLGGWWYAVKINDKLIGTEKEVYNIMPIEAKTKKIGSKVTDLESVKSLGRSKVGNNIPKPMLDWLNRGSFDNAVKEFGDWNKTLNKSFSERKFVKWDINIDELYEKEKQDGTNFRNNN